MRVELEKSNDAKFTEFFARPIEEQRFLFYTDKVVKTESIIIKYETEEKLCYFREIRDIKCFSKPFIKRNTDWGLTYDKKTKKVKMWFGSSVRRDRSGIGVEVMNAMCKDLGIMWYVEMPRDLKVLATPTMIGLMLSKKIYNPIQYCQVYLKRSMKSKASPRLFYDRIISATKAFGSMSGFVSLTQMMMLAKDPDKVFSCVLLDENLINDILKECKILGVKFDWSWSEKRIMQEHTLMTRLIMDMELKFIVDKSVTYTSELAMPKGWRMITNNKDLYRLGREQDHCVYGYWDNVERKTNFIIEVAHNNLIYTLTVSRRHEWQKGDREFINSQFRGKRNSEPTDEAKELVNEFVKKNSDFFEANSPKKVETIDQYIPVGIFADEVAI